MEHLYSLYDALVSINVPGGMARQVVQAMERDMTGELATKSELQNVRNDLHNSIERFRGELKPEIELLRRETKAEIELLRQETRAEFVKVRLEIDQLRQEMHAGFALLRSEMQTMSNQMTVKLGSMMVVSVGLIVTLQKLL